MGTPNAEIVPTLDELRDWARDPTREKWRNLIAALTDLFIANIAVTTGDHSNAYAEVVCRLLDDVATEVRKEFAERVAPIDRFPGQVVKRLASDEEPEVAVPMLEHSPVLTDRDLIDVIEMMLPDHTRAISRRKKLGEKLTDLLATAGDPEVIRTMAANRGAKFSQKTYRMMAEKAKTDVGLQESLVSREDFTTVLAAQITPFLSEELRARLRALDAPPEGGSLLESLSEIASEAERKSLLRKERAAAYSMVEQVRAGIANASIETIKLAESGQVGVLTQFLAGIAQLSDKTIAASLANPNGTPLAVTLKGLGLNQAAVAAIAQMRGASLDLSEHDVAQWVESYARINSRDAEKSLALLREKENAAADERLKPKAHIHSLRTR